MSVSKRVAVVGGGIVGLVAALELSELPGVSVTLYDPAPGTGATYAAAGMLAAAAEARPDEFESYELQLQSIPGWLSVFARIGIDDSHLHRSGTLYVGFDASDRRQLEQLRSVILAHGAEVEDVRRSDVLDLFAGLHPNIKSGLFLPTDAWVDPDLVVKALIEVLKSREVSFVEEKVVSCSNEGAVSTNAGASHFSAVLLATGSAALGANFPRTVNSVRPVRGITAHLHVGGVPTGPMVRAFVRGRDFYAVNRGDGNFVIGASSEERSEMGVELGELERLFRDASEVMPFLEGSVVGEIRRGLRPASASNDPFLERAPDSRVAYSSGHFRHGITLAPVSASATAQLVKEILDEG